MDTGNDRESEEQRVEREAKAKADHDTGEAVPPLPPFRPLGEQNFMPSRPILGMPRPEL